MLVNLANEPSPSEVQFTSGYSDAVMRLRDAGIHVPIVIATRVVIAST